MLGGRPGDGGHQARVVDQLPVIGQQPAAEAVAPDRGAMSAARLAEMRRDRGNVDDQVPAMRAAHRLRGSRCAPAPVPRVPIAGSKGTSCGMALTRCGALRVIRIPRSTALRLAMPTLPVAR